MVPNPTYLALETHSFVRQWLQDCSANHVKCRNALQQTLPTRVIDVIGNESTSWNPFLVESNGEKGNYICLSYCWGGLESFKTTTTNLNQRKSYIPYRGLPQTFSDAIWVTKSLGVRYLWIDSLCIVQDDSADWESESASMSTIYGNSYLTIAASAAPNPETGMFFKVREDVIGPFIVGTTLPGGRHVAVNVRKRLPHSEFIQSRSGGGHPLVTRGWTFQEHLLPTKVLQFGQYEVVWECNEALWCCCSIETLINPGIKASFSKFLYETQDEIEDYRWRIWSNIVFHYSSRSLTKGTDKLVALSGIVSKLQKVWNCRYLGGIWEADLVNGLCWCKNSNKVRGVRPKPYRAPTWSWASVDGELHTFPWRIPNDGFQISVIDVQCEHTTTDPTGLVTSGYLLVLGRLVQVEFLYDSHYTMGFPDFESRDTLCYNGEMFEFNADIDLTSVGSDGVPKIQTAYCLLLGLFQSPMPRSDGPALGREYRILILQKCASHQGAFERIGLIMGWDREGLEPSKWFEGSKEAPVLIV
jgi:hypothetical protein